MTEEKTETKKTSSRKFIVWVVFSVVALVVMLFSVVTMIITKTASDKLIDLLETTLTFFFWLSVAYSGLNVGQKVGLGFANKNKSEESVEND